MAGIAGIQSFSPSVGSAVATALSGATSLANIVLVNPQVDLGITSQFTGERFLFHYEGENTVTLDTDITDHYIEDNTAIQDHIALRPETVTVHGYIGELNDVVPDFLKPLAQAAQKLSLLGPFAPGISATAVLAYNLAFQAYQTEQTVEASVKSLWNSPLGSFIGGATPIQTKQQEAYVKFQNFWFQRQLFTVQTPWAVFRDMALKSVRAVQEENTRMVSDFEVTFKRMRFAVTEIANQLIPSMQGRAVAQASSVVDHGASTPAWSQPLDTSVV